MTRIPAAHPDNLEPAVDWRATAACHGEPPEMFFLHPREHVPARRGRQEVPHLQQRGR